MSEQCQTDGCEKASDIASEYCGLCQYRNQDESEKDTFGAFADRV